MLVDVDYFFDFVDVVEEYVVVVVVRYGCLVEVVQCHW